jgi:hypothetical protein
MAQKLISQSHLKSYYFLIVLASLFRVISGQVTVSILEDPSFTTQRLCVQACVWGNGVDGPSDVGDPNPWIMEYSLQCPVQEFTYQNSCFCRPDLSSIALSYISTCVSSLCTADTTDVSNAVSVYTAYCSTAVGAANPATVSATSTSSSTQSSTSAGQGTNTAIQTTKSNAVSSITTSVGASELLLMCLAVAALASSLCWFGSKRLPTVRVRYNSQLFNPPSQLHHRRRIQTQFRLLLHRRHQALQWMGRLGL